MEIGWGTAAVWMGLALLASFISIRFKLSVALVEILVGAAAGNIALLLNQNHVFGDSSLISTRLSRDLTLCLSGLRLRLAVFDGF